uniref:(California timema) hypothetical protein n=1 Tax=Timema californicum TaxID=61474 RepID=A0A7R9JBP9_TIMCA|nr:unnamed protein product [Timema californicum]
MSGGSCIGTSELQHCCSRSAGSCMMVEGMIRNCFKGILDKRIRKSGSINMTTRSEVVGKEDADKTPPDRQTLTVRFVLEYVTTTKIEKTTVSCSPSEVESYQEEPSRHDVACPTGEIIILAAKRKSAKKHGEAPNIRQIIVFFIGGEHAFLGVVRSSLDCCHEENELIQLEHAFLGVVRSSLDCCHEENELIQLVPHLPYNVTNPTHRYWGWERAQTSFLDGYIECELRTRSPCRNPAINAFSLTHTWCEFGSWTRQIYNIYIEHAFLGVVRSSLDCCHEENELIQLVPHLPYNVTNPTHRYWGWERAQTSFLDGYIECELRTRSPCRNPAINAFSLTHTWCEFGSWTRQVNTAIDHDFE